MTDEPTPTTIAEITSEIEAARQELYAIFLTLPPSAFDEPSSPNDWSLRDHMAHLATWLHGMVALLRHEHRWDAMGLPRELAQTQDTDAFNTFIYEKYKSASPAEIQPLFEGAQAALLATLATMTDADLQTPYESFRVAGTDWDKRRGAVVEWIVGNSYEHYRQHIPWMWAWVKRYHPQFMPVKPTIAGLTDALEKAREHLEEAYSHLPEDQLTTPSSPEDWSVKDHLAHLATWAAGIAALLRREHRWQAMGLTHEFIQENEIDLINNVIYERYKEASWAEVSAYFDTVHKDILAQLAQMTDADLQQPYDAFQGEVTGIYDAEDTRPVINWIIGNTSGHYGEHLPWMKYWIALHHTQ